MDKNSLDKTTIEKQTADSRYVAVKHNSIIAAIVNTLLGIIKIIVGFWGNSHALIADGFHSLSDLITDFLIVVASRYGTRSADVKHPYGYGRIETLATAAISILLMIVGAGIIYDGIYHILYGVLMKPQTIVLWIVVFSIITKELLYHYTRKIAVRVKSELLYANAWHHRTDAASSIIVLIGVFGAMVGILYLDDIAAIIVGLMIIYVGWSLVRESIGELIDVGVDEKILAQINHHILAINGVQAIHQLRTRSMHGRILMDVHVLVDPGLSVSEGHHIAQQVHYTLMALNDAIFDVTVHIDPENDEVAQLNFDLPSRQVLMPQLKALWHDLPGAGQIEEVILHYIAGKILVQIILPIRLIDKSTELKAIQALYQKALGSIKDISEVEILLNIGVGLSPSVQEQN